MVVTRRLNQLRESVDITWPAGELVVALSGGADSGALAWLGSDSSRLKRAIHVDHGLPASSLMRSAAVDIAEHIGLELEVVTTSLTPGPSPEGQARSARYEALAGVVHPGEQLLTAHTVEDNVETVLINLVRGTGTRGLAGIPPFRPPNIHRPLLNVSRSVLREIAILADLPFVDDPMNFDPAITRTRIRTVLLPRLREMNPSLVRTVGAMTDTVRADADYLDRVASIHHLPDSRGGVRIPVGELKAMPQPIADRVIIDGLERAGLGPTRDRLDRVQAVIGGRSQREELAGGVEARRDGPFLVIDGESDPETSIDLEAGQHHHHGRIFHVIEVDGICRVAPLSRWHAVFPADTVLTVGSDGVVAAGGEPAWIPGEKRFPVAWYQPGTVGYLSVFAREESGWT